MTKNKSTLRLTRLFSKEGISPYDEVTWETRTATVGRPGEKPVFEQEGVEVPDFWSQQATNIVAQKYFAYGMDNPRREYSVRQMIDRVVETIASAGIDKGYFNQTEREIFADELRYILLHQLAAFNSPVWFNVGVEGAKPQTSACFILAVDDSLESIAQWYTEEMKIFQRGSGAGVNVSNLRGSAEPLSLGGFSSGPVTFMRAADASAGTIQSGGTCLAPWQLVLTERGPVPVKDLDEFIALSFQPSLGSYKAKTARAFASGEKALVRVHTDKGHFDFSADHPIKLLSGEFVPAGELGEGQLLMSCVVDEVKNLPDVFRSNTMISATVGEQKVDRVEKMGIEKVYDVEVDCPTLDDKSPETGHNFVVWPEGGNSGIVVANTRRAAKMVVMDIDHPDVEDFIWCKAHEEDRIRALRAAGFAMDIDGGAGERNMAEATSYQNANNSVRLSDGFLKAVEEDGDWELTARGDGSIIKTVKARELMRQVSEAAWKCADPGVQYDTTINDWHTSPAQGPITASNPCSEYMSNDNSACNLASLNLLRFLNDENQFDVEAFAHAARIVFTAQEITIAFGHFPTRKIARNSRSLRQIGIGFANLGALLMALGLAYDSDEGRDLAGSITALLTGESYLQSTYLAERVEPFAHFEENRDSVLRVLGKHRAAARKLTKVADSAKPIVRAARVAWEETVKRAEEVGVRNAQASVLAPTGCLVPESMVVTDQGLARLDELGDTSGQRWQDIDFNVQTDEGPRPADKFYVNGLADVFQIKTSRGYNITGTGKHRLKVTDQEGQFHWRRLDEIEPGDKMPLLLGGMIGEPRQVRLAPLSEPYFAGSRQDVTVPERMSPELAELIGYFMGDGSLHSRGLRFQVSGEDRDVVDHIKNLAKKLFNIDCQQTEYKNHNQVELNSCQIAIWWQDCGFSKLSPAEGHGGKGWVPHIPAAVRASNDQHVYAAFLRGLYEADGGAYEDHTILLSSAKESFVNEIRQLLLLLEIPTQTKIDKPGPGHYGKNPVHVLRVVNRAAAQTFIKKVGFISSRKTSALLEAKTDSLNYQCYKNDQIPVSRALVDELCQENNQLRHHLLQALARKGTVSRYLANQLLEASADRRVEHLLGFYYDEVESARFCGQRETYDLSVPDNVTYIANGLISHNTIAFLMDCDTTGIEPDFSLIKYKSLSGGGSMTIVNQTVPRALRQLGYSHEEIEEIIAYLGEEVDKGGGFEGPRGSVVGAPHLKEEHYSVFDCAIGERAISPMGHVYMMAACQPFLSGAISKTVNMPESASVEEIEEVYLEGGKLGLKAIAVYRDSCKAFQPLGDAKQKIKRDEEAEEAVEQRITSLLGDGLLRGERRRVPREAEIVGVHFTVAQTSGYIHARLFEDGRPGAIFIDVGQAGSTLRGFINALAITMSVSLQHGTPLDIIVSKLANMQFEPYGITDDPQIRQARSLVDYFVKWMAAQFLDPAVHPELGINIAEQPTPDSGELAPEVKVHAQTVPAQTERRDEIKMTTSSNPLCTTCGTLMVKTGSCYTCPACGTSGGCG